MQVALAQTNSISDLNANLSRAEKLCAEAAERGASWIIFPEYAPFMGTQEEILAIAEPLHGPIIQMYAGLAQSNQIWVTVGSYAEKSDIDNMTYNTLVMISPNGEIVETYRKIHRFDAVTPSNTYQESSYVLPGDEVKVCSVTVDNEIWCVGLSICYDLRFPELYRKLRSKGAQLMLVPSAFTLETGRDHWHPLLAARAIENQSYVLGANQFGCNYGNRWSYGHSVFYDPWGRMLASASDKIGLVICEIDHEFMANIRKKMPVEEHRCIDTLKIS